MGSLLNHRFRGRGFLQVVEMLGLGADRQILDCAKRATLSDGRWPAPAYGLA